VIESLELEDALPIPSLGKWPSMTRTYTLNLEFLDIHSSNLFGDAFNVYTLVNTYSSCLYGASVDLGTKLTFVVLLPSLIFNGYSIQLYLSLTLNCVACLLSFYFWGWWLLL